VPYLSSSPTTSHHPYQCHRLPRSHPIHNHQMINTANTDKYRSTHHHHHHMHAPSWSIAVSTRCFQCSRSWAYFHAQLRPRLWGWDQLPGCIARYDEDVREDASNLGQYSGHTQVDVLSALVMSSDVSIHAMCLSGLKRLSTVYVNLPHLHYMQDKKLKTENTMYVPYIVYHTLHALSICLCEHTHVILATTLFYI